MVPSPTPDRRGASRPRGRLLAWLLLPLLALALLGWGIVQLARSEAGTRALLERVPGLQASGVHGSLLGDALRIESLRWHGNATQPQLQIEQLELTQPRWHWRPHAGAWLALATPSLKAARVQWHWPRERAPAAAPPANLRLPFALQVDALDIAVLQVDEQTPWHDVRAALRLGDADGREHRIEGLRGHDDRLRIAGDARIGSDAPMPLAARLQAAPVAEQGPRWQAQLEADGPLAGFALRATLRGTAGQAQAPSPNARAPSQRAQPPSPGVQPPSPRVQAPSRGQAPPREAQAPSLDATARIEPFAPWPLAALALSTRALDLAELSAAAPRTRIDADARIDSSGLDRPALASLQLRNHEPGRWDDHRAPIRELRIELGATPNRLDRIEFKQFDAELADEQRAAGRVHGRGEWTHAGVQLQLKLAGVEPARLHRHAGVMTLGGTLDVHVSGVPLPLQGSATTHTGAWRARIAGALDGTLAGVARPVHADLDLALHADGFELTKLLAQSGDASLRATLKAQRAHGGTQPAWQLAGQGEVARFDPLPWWPGAAGSAWGRGPHRINGSWQIDAQVPAAAPRAPAAAQTGGAAARMDPSPGDAAAALTAWASAVRGQARIDLADSVLAGTATSAHIEAHGDGRALAVKAQARVAGNQASVDGQWAADPAQDQWQLSTDAPALAALRPVAALFGATPASLWPDAGALKLQGRLEGRWPALRSSGSLQASGLRQGEHALRDAQARWRLGTVGDAPLEFALDASGLAGGTGAPRVDTLESRLDGTLRTHRFSLRADSPLRPPPWSEKLLGSAAAGTRLALEGRGAWAPLARGAATGAVSSGASGASNGRWQLSELSLRIGARDAPAGTWLDAQGLQGHVDLDAQGALQRAVLQPGRVLLAGSAALRWSEAAWQAAGQRIDLRGDLEPLPVAPLLARAQPDIGWRGDLTLAGHVELHANERFAADIVLERAGGDLLLDSEIGTPQALGLSELRLAFSAQDGVWQLAHGIAGRQFGEMAGAEVVRTTAQARWPDADAPLSGVTEMRVANLNAWGVWVPPGWRLGGQLQVSGELGGRFGAPELRGSMSGRELSVRNVLQGVGLSDGELDASLDGEVARVQRFTFKGGDGTLQLSGQVRLGEAPNATLRLQAERFRLLGRIDRRLVATGRADLTLERTSLKLDGRFAIDEGLIDFSRGDAPSLDGDVSVVRAASPAPGGNAGSPTPGGNAASAAPSGNGAPPRNASLPAPLRNAQVDLALDLGQHLQVRGRGLDASLRGDLRLTTPGGHPAVNGKVHTASGTYAAYAQKLVIDRGELSFSGAGDNPRLDIVAVRPNLDVRVGVEVTGQLQSPRVRLFSEPEMTEMDKLSWLVMGRASEGLGRNDTALLQRAALALLAGEHEAPNDPLLQQLGLTDIAVRQSDGEVHETIVSIGRQLSQRWYVGYERSVNATTGTWQLVYRIAQRFTLRAQSGVDNSLDFIWSWRW